MKRITMVIAGLGGRGHDIYGNYAMEHPDEVEIAAVADPRPERLETIELYEKEMPEFGMRLQVKAGLTGYAQVYGKANTSPYDKLQMDLMYIGEQSVITDLKIIFATIKILFMPESTEGFAEEKDALCTDEVTDSMQ